MAGEDLSFGFLGLSPDFWDLWREEKKLKSEEFELSLKPLFSRYIKSYSTMKNRSLNYPIQATAADMTKLALILFYKRIIKEDLWMVVKIVNIVHDEIVIECPIEMGTMVSQWLVEDMITAGKYFSIVEMGADFEIGLSWEH